MRSLILVLIGVAIGAAALAAVSGSSGVEEVRIAARWLSASRFEVGLQQRQTDGSWSEVVEPTSNVVSSRSHDWTFSSSVAVRPSAADGAVEFRVTAESIYASPAPIAETRCDFAFLYRNEQSPVVWFNAPAGEMCDGADVREPLLLLNDSRVLVDPEDPQAEYASSWLWRLGDGVRDLSDEDLTLAEFEAVMALAYQDFMPSSARPPAVVYEAGRDVTLHDFSANEILTGSESISPARALGSIAYYLTGASEDGNEREGSGPEMAAQTLAVHQRYVPGFDVDAARELARRLGVLVAWEAPVEPVRRDSGVIVRVRQLLGLPDAANRATGDILALEEPLAEARFSINSVDGVLSASSPFGSFESSCDLFTVARGYLAVWVRPDGWGDCEDGDQLIPVGFVEGADTPFDEDDPQLYSVYDWERQIDANLLPAAFSETITQGQAQQIVDAVFADLFGSSRQPPRVRETDDGYSSYSHQFRQIRIQAGAWDAATVLHETVHAALAVQRTQTFARWQGHGREYAATILMLWERYVPGFDAEQARADAAVHGVEIAGRSPIRPSGGTAGADSVTDVLGLTPLAETAAAVSPSAAGVCTYLVMPGDVVFSIAFRHGISLEELIVLNPGLAGDVIVPGEELVVPCR